MYRQKKDTSSIQWPHKFNWTCRNTYPLNTSSKKHIILCINPYSSKLKMQQTYRQKSKSSIWTVTSLFNGTCRNTYPLNPMSSALLNIHHCHVSQATQKANICCPTGKLYWTQESGNSIFPSLSSLLLDVWSNIFHQTCLPSKMFGGTASVKIRSLNLWQQKLVSIRALTWTVVNHNLPMTAM